ncbi:MAG TPA: polysaccharide deacetylase family protein [Polyangiaceae bacterium]|nr:polysaccharide deacetylase family protein [Polyangiaceae bacterium]
MKLCAVSVDLDEIPNYFRIHGLAEPGELVRHAVYDVAIDRLMAMAAAGGLPLTLFAIGADLARAESAVKLRQAREAGHEMANHSLDHRYDLTRLDRAEILYQIAAGADAVERATGERPVGFRAPGYTITDQVFSVLRELGVLYDSSVFPCPAYYAAKATALAWIRVRGRKSHSVLDTPRVLAAPTRPYRVGTPYWKTGDGVLELPIQVTRGLRLPVIGTSLTLAGPARARTLARMCRGAPLVNLELHGIDVLDASDGLDALLPFQPDVRVSRARKLESLHAAFDTLRHAGYAFVTLREAAAALG